MSARDAIFAAIGADAHPAATAAALLARVPGLRPDRVGNDAVESFLARLTGPSVAATAARVASLAEVPAAVRDYLRVRGLGPRIALQPAAALRALDWAGLETHGGIAVDEAASVCLAAYAVAETGSLVFRSGADMPVLFAFLPMHHIVVVEAAGVVAWLEDCAAREAGRPAPRNLILVTGPSGTTDIEGVLVRGAHGPGHLHVILAGAGAGVAESS